MDRYRPEILCPSNLQKQGTIELPFHPSRILISWVLLLVIDSMKKVKISETSKKI